MSVQLVALTSSVQYHAACDASLEHRQLDRNVVLNNVIFDLFAYLNFSN